MEYILNPIARAIGKQPEAFTKADIIKYIVDQDIHAVNFRYTGGDGHLKELNFIIQDLEYLDEVLSSGERVDGSSLRSASSVRTWTRMVSPFPPPQTRYFTVQPRPSVK